MRFISAAKKRWEAIVLIKIYVVCKLLLTLILRKVKIKLDIL